MNGSEWVIDPGNRSARQRSFLAEEEKNSPEIRKALPSRVFSSLKLYWH